jgi:hypothetical protein
VKTLSFFILVHSLLNIFFSSYLGYLLPLSLAHPIILLYDQSRAGRSWVRIPTSTWDFIFSRNVQTESGAHPDPYSMCNGLLSRGIDRPRCEVDQSSPSSAEVKNEWSYTSSWRKEGLHHFYLLPSYLYVYTHRLSTQESCHSKQYTRYRERNLKWNPLADLHCCTVTEVSQSRSAVKC